MFSTEKSTEVHLTRKQESLVRYVYPKLVAHIEETWKVDSTPEEIEERKVEALQETRELVHKYGQEIQGISRLTGILKRRYGQELEQMVGELQLDKVTAKELLNLIIKLESNSAIPQEEVKAELMKWVNRAEKYIVKQIEEAVAARQVAEQKTAEAIAARQEEVRARVAIEQQNTVLAKRLEEMEAIYGKQQAESSPDANIEKKALLSHSVELSTPDPKRIKIGEKVEKANPDDAKPDEALNKTRKPNIV